MENHHVYVRQIIKHPLFYGSWLPYSFVKWPEGIYKYKEMQMNEVQFSDMTRFWSSEQILKHVGFPRPISVGSGQWSGWELDVHHGQCRGWELDIHWVWVFSAAFLRGIKLEEDWCVSSADIWRKTSAFERLALICFLICPHAKRKMLKRDRMCFFD